MVVTVVTTYLLYANTQRLFRWSVEETLRSVAGVAALQFASDQLDQIQGHDDWKKPVYRQVVIALENIRRHTSHVKFIYILRKTADPNTMEFVADADSLDPDTPVDLNSDGKIDDSDALTHPGDPYDVSQFPEFQRDGFSAPFVDPELSHDQWGTFLSGTAPIVEPGDAGGVRYLIGIDMDVSDFLLLTNLAIVPFLLFVVFLVLILTALTVSLRRMWRYQVQLLTEIDRQKDELLSIVSHQLLAPVTSIRYCLEMLLEGEYGPLRSQQSDQLTSVVASSRHLVQLVQLLLDVSRIELGRLHMEKQPVPLVPFFQSVVDVIEPQAKVKGVRLIRKLPQELPAGLLDERLTRMAVENLLSNAVKYTPPGGAVTLTVTLDGKTIRCEVQDTGCGIPKADQPRLFKKLYRASNAGTTEGNGFGLYVAKGAIEQQSGTLGFRSEEGKGSTFWIEMQV